MFAQHNHSLPQLSGHAPVIEAYMAANWSIITANLDVIIVAAINLKVI